MLHGPSILLNCFAAFAFVPHLIFKEAKKMNPAIIIPTIIL